MGCIFGFFFIVAKVAWFLLKLFVKGLYYTAPILICVAMFFISGFVGVTAYSGQDVAMENEIIKKHVYKVTVYWAYDEHDTESTGTFYVRDDLEWNIGGYNSEARMYGFYFEQDFFDKEKSVSQQDYSANTPVVPTHINTDSNLKFKGLFTTINDSETQGEQYVNAAGYSLRPIQRDMILFARWGV